MRKTIGKTPLSRLDPKSYRTLHRKILERDGWRCQACGRMQNLQVHHHQFRSQSGADEEQNLITMCAECHARVQVRPTDVANSNGDH